MRHGLLNMKRGKQALRESAFRKEDHLFQHSEVSERRLRRARMKGTEERMELGTSQGMRLAMNMQLRRGLAYQPPPLTPRRADSNGQRGSQKLLVS